MINPKKELYNFLNSSYYGEKIKESRKKCNLTIEGASKITKIPPTTLQRYENGETKKIPKEAIQQLCEAYKEKENIFLNVSYIEFFNSLFPVISLTLFGMEFDRLNLPDSYYKKLGIDKEVLKNLKRLKKKLLTEEEQIEYKRFLKLVEIALDMKKGEIKNKEYQDILFSIFFFHQLRKKVKSWRNNER